MGKFEKSLIIISIALISLLCLGAVSAADDIAADDLTATDGEDMGSIDEVITENDDLSLEEDDAAGVESSEILGEDAPKTFTQLKEEITNPVDGVVTLSGTYKYDETADADLGVQGVVIQNNITIKGPATLDGSNLSRIFYLYQSSATLEGLTLINAKGQQYGGAILVYGLSPTIENCIFKNNLVTDDKDQYYAYGGAVYFWSTSGATVNNCTFEENVANLDYSGCGGAIYEYSDGLTIKDSTFKHNQAFTGGALESYGQNMKIDKCLFDSNQAITGSDPYYNGEAGAIMLNYVLDDDYNPVESNHKLTGSVFINNQAGNHASALKNEAIGTTIKDCIFIGPETLMGESILSGCQSGTDCENIWLGHTAENQSTYVNGGPDNWLVLDLNAVAEEGYYNVVASLNHLYTRSTGEVTDVQSGISDIVFNVAATAGTCDETVEIKNGIGTIIYKLYKPEEGTISIDYNGVTQSLSLEGLEKLPEDVYLVINVEDIKKGEIAKVDVQLTDLEGNGIAGADLVVVVNDVEQNIVTGADGKFSLDVEDLNPGQYSAFVTFAGKDFYKRAINSTIFNVNPEHELNVDVSVDGGNIVVSVTDEEGNPVDSAKVNVTIDGAAQEFTTDNGVVTIPAASGDHNLTISTEDGKTLIVKVVAGESTPDGGSTPVTDKIETVIDVSHTSISTYNKAIDSKDDAYVLVTLKDANGNILANKSFKFILDGKVYSYVTDGNGQKKISILSAAKKTISTVILVSGDDQYNESVKAVNIKVNPQKVKIVAKKKTFKANKKVKKFTATLTNSKGKAIKGKKIVFTINKKKYTAKTNKKGVATVKVKLSKKKTYKVTINFAGDNTYNKSTKKSKIVIK